MVKEKKRTDRKGDKSVVSPASLSDYPESAKPDGSASRPEVSSSGVPASGAQLKGLKKECRNTQNKDATQYEEPVLTRLIVER